jgi:uncharacterized membrane protein
MQCKLDLIILNKTKEDNPLLRIIQIQWQNALNTVTNILMQVNIPAKDGSQQSAIFTHALKVSSTFVPIHAHSGQALSYPLQALQAKHKQQKETFATLIVILKLQTIK